MFESKRTDVVTQPLKKTGNWEILLTDPSLNRFNFGQHTTDKYISTDIISPYGQKSILYNTVPKESSKPVVISLGFDTIDNAKISSISFKASKDFYLNWKVLLYDNRSNSEIVINSDTEFYVEPNIEVNTLIKMGFFKDTLQSGQPLFELHLYRS